MNQPANNTGIFPTFSIKAIENKAASEEKGYPVFKEVEWITIHIAGDKGTIIERKVMDEDRERWAEIYSQFKANQEQIGEGLPVEHWPVLTVGKVAMLKALNIHTVEALAELPDGRLKVLGMDGRELQNKAKAFLSKAAGEALEQKQAAEITRLTEEIDMLKRQIKELGADPAEKKPRRKRRTKAEMEVARSQEVA